MTTSDAPDDRCYTDDHEWVADLDHRGSPPTRCGSGSAGWPPTTSATSSSSTCPTSAPRSAPARPAVKWNPPRPCPSLFSPVTGTVTEVNTEAVDDPAAGQHRPLRRGLAVRRPGDRAGTTDDRRRIRREERIEPHEHPQRTAGRASIPTSPPSIDSELHRQQTGLEMIASENYAPLAVMQAQGSVLTNKYAEGYPGRRYYGGCEYIDGVEQLAIDRVKALFGAEYANVQPHSGATANAAVMHALLNPGDTILGSVPGPRRPSHPRHADQLLRQAVQRRGLRGVQGGLPHRHGRGCRRRPRASPQDDHRRVVGLPAPPGLRPAFREIADEVDAVLDGRHGALRRTGRHRSASVAGARMPTSSPPPPTRPSAAHAAAIILTNDAAIAKKINSAVFPGQQGGPLEHVIAAKADGIQDGRPARIRRASTTLPRRGARSSPND